MPHTYEELKKKTIAELREIAKDVEHEAVQGYTQLNKEHLLPALCKALGIDSHAHHAATIAEKADVKAKMRDINTEKAKAVESRRPRSPAPAPPSLPSAEPRAPQRRQARGEKLSGAAAPAAVQAVRQGWAGW